MLARMQHFDRIRQFIFKDAIKRMIIHTFQGTEGKVCYLSK